MTKPLIKSQKAWAILVGGKSKRRIAVCHCHNDKSAFLLFKNKPTGYFPDESTQVLITPLTKKK